MTSMTAVRLPARRHALGQLAFLAIFVRSRAVPARARRLLGKPVIGLGWPAGS